MSADVEPARATSFGGLKEKGDDEEAKTAKWEYPVAEQELRTCQSDANDRDFELSLSF